jgi:hypothetical protein
MHSALISEIAKRPDIEMVRRGQLVLIEYPIL